jgi:hypothetical protein
MSLGTTESEVTMVAALVVGTPDEDERAAEGRVGPVRSDEGAAEDLNSYQDYASLLIQETLE